MNKQMIEELAKQAGLMCLYDYGPEEDPHAMVVGQKDMELFAELLIKECAKVCNDVGVAVFAEPIQSNFETAQTCKLAIAMHFGVKP